MEYKSTIKYMKPIAIKTSILLFLSIVLGFIQHSQITKSCTDHVKYVTELNNVTTYTFWQCYWMQMETSMLLTLVLWITLISVIIFIIKLLYCWISYFFEKKEENP